MVFFKGNISARWKELNTHGKTVFSADSIPSPPAELPFIQKDDEL